MYYVRSESKEKTTEVGAWGYCAKKKAMVGYFATFLCMGK